MKDKFGFTQSAIEPFGFFQIENAIRHIKFCGEFRDFRFVSSRQNRFQTALGGKSCNKLAGVTVCAVEQKCFFHNLRINVKRQKAKGKNQTLEIFPEIYFYLALSE